MRPLGLLWPFAIAAVLVATLSMPATARGDASADLPAEEVLLAIAGDEALRERYVDQRPRGQYRVYIDDGGKTTRVEVVTSIAGVDALVDARLKAIRWKSDGKPTQLLVPVVVALPYPLHEPNAAPSAAADTRPKNVPPHFFDKEMVSMEDPHLPSSLKAAAAGKELTAMYKVCVGRHGRVTSVSVLSSIPDGGDDAIMATVFRWKLKPQPTPICTIARWVFVTR
jgi:hypothetical protein